MDVANPPNLDRCIYHDGTVIALGMYWDWGTWHFTHEALVGLATVKYRELFAEEPNARVQIGRGAVSALPHTCLQPVRTHVSCANREKFIMPYWRWWV
jgi:hypothetical protein